MEDAANAKYPFLRSFRAGKGHSREKKTNTLALSERVFMFFLGLPGKIIGQILAEERGAEIYLRSGSEGGWIR